MLDLSKTCAVFTGASRGLGVVIADALAERGVSLVLAARSETGLNEVKARLDRHGGRVRIMPTDLGKREQLERLVAFAQREFGFVDLLVNNAGIEQMCLYDKLDPEIIEQTIAVNLTAPMLLTRMLLPAMLEANRGHILNIASIAGLAPTAFGEPYGATKHGLVGFTRSLRASLQTVGSQVSASVVCPGFVSDAGMLADLQREHEVAVPAMLGTCRPEAVAKACLRALARNEPELIVNSRPFRPMLMLGAPIASFRAWQRSARCRRRLRLGPSRPASTLPDPVTACRQIVARASMPA
jgi:short-subunit dehydrogenase